jgi:UDP-glucose 4-epimerase
MPDQKESQSPILIIGGAGFIGAELVRQLSKQHKFHLIVIDNDSKRLLELDLPKSQKYCVSACNTIEVFRIIEKERIKGIIHFAANSDIKAGSLSSEFDFNNTLITSLVLSEIVKLRKFEFVLFASTSAVYGNEESAISLQSPRFKVPISSYGWAKLASESALKLATQESQTPFILARFPNVVGPRPTHGVLYDFKAKLKSNSKVLEILGNGEQTKPYLHVDDLLKVLIRAIARSRVQVFTELNIGPGDDLRLKELVEIVLEISGLTPEQKYGLTPHGWVGDVPSYSYGDSLPPEYSDLVLRGSAWAVRDAFFGFWND